MRTKLLMFIIGIIVISCNSSPTHEDGNVLVVRKYYNAVNGKNASSADQLVTENYTKINNDKLADKNGPALLSQSIKEHIRNNKDYRFIIEDIYSYKDKVTVRWRWESINIQYGKERKVTSQGISIFKIRDDKIDTLWQAFDILGFNKQLGVN